jgi:hypothetical protein
MMSDNKYYIWPSNSSSLIVNTDWVEVSDQMALDRLGKPHAIFYPHEVAFFQIRSSSPELEGLRDLVAFTVSDAGDRSYSLLSSLVKHVHDYPRFRYLIRPADFLSTQRSTAINLALNCKKDPYGIEERE